MAETSINLSFSWIVDWIELTYRAAHEDEATRNETLAQKEKMLHRCTRQAQMLFYGAYNWKSSEETILN